MCSVFRILRRATESTRVSSSAASDVYNGQSLGRVVGVRRHDLLHKLVRDLLVGWGLLKYVRGVGVNVEVVVEAGPETGR